MRRRSLLWAAGAALPARAQTAAATPPLRALTADDFRGSRQRGVGVGALRHGDRSEADHDAVLALGAGHVRVFLDAKREGLADQFTWPPAQLTALDSLLANLQRRGLYAVISVDFGPDARDGREGRDTMWRNLRLQDSAVQLWRQMATRLRGRTMVAGFDIVNEPVPPGITYAVRQDRWLDFASRVIEAVRLIDPQRVLILQSAPDATPESFANLRPLPYGGLVYSLHSYNPFAFSHQGVMAEFPQARAYPERMPDGRSSAQVLAESLQIVAQFARRYDMPIYVGEFSAPRWAPDGSAARYVADSIALFNGHGWSWAYHEFRAWHGWDPEMDSARRDAQPRSNAAPVVQVLRAGLRASRG